MGNFIKVVVFSLVVIGLYVLFSVKYIPPITPAPPPKEEVLDLSEMTMDDFVALGEKIYEGKGTCTLCHNPVMKRAPLLERAAIVAKERLKDPRYKGEAKTVKDYLYESLVKPSAYVVKGYGVTGTNDTVSPMPDVSKGAIGLNEVELWAVVAYMQKLSGADITVEIPKGEAMAKEEKKEEKKEPARTPQAVIEKYGCSACHKMTKDGMDPGLGPDLSKIGAARDKEYLRRAIVDPNAEIAEGFSPMMPDTYKDQMTAGELELLVEYLAAQK